MSTTGIYSSQDAATALLNAEDPREVEDILSNEYFADQQWKPLGQQENNYGIVENQAGAPVPALVELITNSYDAILMKEYHNRAGTTDPDPDSDDLPEIDDQSEAVEELIQDQDSQRVEIRADGYKPSNDDIINFTVIDNGCGQPPEEFEETFLGLLDPGKYKQDYPFLQGQYGMGSSGVLQFSGGKSYKFICSASHRNPSEWSWSIVRQNKQRDQYEYLTIDGEIPTFTGSVEEQTFGSFVKVYDYELNMGKTIITGDERFQKRLERYLVDPPFPLQLSDTRYSSTNVDRITTPGLIGRIKKHDHLVEENYDIKYNFDHDQLGVRNINIITFKDNGKIDELREKGDATRRNKSRFVGGTDHREMAILYTVNGQTHGNEGVSFLKNRCDKPRVGEDTIAIVEFSDIAGTEMVDLFQPTRDRIKKKEIGEKLQEGMKDALKNDNWLIEEESRRRQKLASEDTDELLDETLQSIIEENPELQRYFESGEKAASDTPSDEEKRPYTCPDIPDTFKIIEEYDPDGNHTFYDEEKNGSYELEVPINRPRRMRFFLNAPNDYISKEGNGELRVKPSRDAIQYVNLNRGILSVKIKAPDVYEVGDTITLVLNVTRPDREPLRQRIRVKYTEEEETTRGTQTPEDDTSEGTKGLSMPNVVPVEEDEWDRHKFDEHDIARVAAVGDSVSDMDVYVNTHAAPLRRFIDKHDLRSSSKEFVEERYKMAVALYSVSMYIEFDEMLDEEDQDSLMTPEEMVKSSMRGLGQVFLHSIAPEELLSKY